MRAIFTDEQDALAEAAAGLAASGLDGARAALDGRTPPGEPTASLVSGFDGLGLAEDVGGIGGDLVDLGIVVSALGRTATPTTWVSHQLALHTAAAAGIDVRAGVGAAERWVVVTDPAHAVRDGAEAGAAVVVEADAVRLVEVHGATPVAGADPTRPLARLDLGDTRAEGQVADPLRRARAVVAAELVGVGYGAIDLAVGHAKDREQFGKPIGSFQGVAHQLADAWTDVELAWSLALHACWAVDEGVDAAARAVSAAKAKAGQAAVHACERSVQAHGGIGITWEADPHLLLRRAIASDAWFGSGRTHVRDLGAGLLGGA